MLPLSATAFFASGFAALLYVIWQRLLVLFSGAELAIALFGFFSRALYYDVLYNRLGAATIPAPALALLLFVSLLVPTFFMGASLPLLSRALASRLELDSATATRTRRQHSRWRALQRALRAHSAAGDCVASSCRRIGNSE
jgi:hypothetical protein